MLTPEDLLRTLNGIAHGTQLQQFGCTRKQLAAAADSGMIRRVRTGVFALPSTDPRVVAAAEHGGALTCAAALRAQDIWVLPKPKDELHVWMGNAGRTHHERCACVAHYSPGKMALGVAPVTPALIHLYRCDGQETFFAAYESAWNQRLIGAGDRANIKRQLPRSAYWLLDLAGSDADSGLESLLRVRLYLLGIRLDCQVKIDTVGRVDFVIGGRVILEADGELNHTNEKRHKDLMRDAAASAIGYETLRFDYAMILYEWDRVVAAILPALARARA